MCVVVAAELKYQHDEDGPAVVFCCRSGKGRTTTAMVIAGLVICHIKVVQGARRPFAKHTQNARKTHALHL